MANFNDIPSFSISTRADFNNAMTLLTNYFISKGLSAADAAAQAGGVINAKMTGGSVEQNLQQTSDTLAAQAAQRAKDQAAADVQNAAILAKQKTTQNAKDAIANAALQAERNKLANFGDSETVGMCADPDNPRGAKIPCDQANAKLAARQLTTQDYNAPASSVIDQHTIDALKARNTPLLSNPKVINITKPFSTTTGITDPTKQNPGSSDPIKNGINFVTNELTQVQNVINNAVKTAQDTGENILKAAQDALNNAGLGATDAAKSALTQLQSTIQGGAKAVSETITSTEKAASDAAATTLKTLQDTAAALAKQAQDAAAAAQKAAQDAIAQGTKAAQDAAAALVKQAQDAAAAAQDAAAKAAAAVGGAAGTAAGDALSLNNTLQKLLGFLDTQSQDHSKTTPTPTPPPNPTDNSNNSSPPPASKPTLTDQANAFLKKYAVPLTLAISATGALIFATSRMSKRSEIIPR